MMNVFKIAYIIAFVLVTLLTVAIKPTMHKPMNVEDSGFKIQTVEQKESSKPVNVQTVVQQVVSETPVQVYETKRDTKSDDSSNYRVKNVSVQNQQNYQSNKNWNFDNYANNSNKTVTVAPQKNTTSTQQVKVVQKPSTTQNVVISEQEQLKKFEKIMNESTKNPNKDLTLDEIETVLNVLTANNVGSQKPTQQTVQKSVQKPTSTVTTQPQTKTLTEQEEIIAWNKWRANLQNRVMNDSHVYAPLGTVFMFSCVVDKYGNISNINAWSTNPDYTAMAKRNVKPALAALQGQAILKFPVGTKRNSTVVAGSFIISTSDRYASPNDYSDYERVKTYGK